ncbi:MAG: TolC family protein [Bacteroidia bacterium]
MNKILAFLVALLLPCSLVRAQLSLDEAIRLSIENSPTGKQIRAQYLSNYWQFKASKAARLPQLGLFGSAPGYTRRINQVFQPDGSFVFAPVQQAFSSANLSLSQLIPATGGMISVGSGLSRGDIFTGASTTFYNNNLLTVNLQQPIFRFNTTKWQWQQDKLQMKAATRQQIENLEDLSVLVTQRYFDVYTAYLQLNNARFNESINDTIYKIAKGRYGVGKIAENELLQVELSYTNARNQVEQQVLQVQLAERQLALLLGRTVKAVEITPPVRTPKVNVDPQMAINEAMNNRSDPLNWAMNENSARRALTEAKRNRRLSAEMNISYGLNQTGATFDASTQNPLESQFAGISFSIPIASMGLNRANQKAAEAGLEAQQAQIELNRNNMEQSVFAAALQLKQLENSLNISAKADTIAQKRYEVAKNRYRIGTVDITNLLIAQNEKDQALITYVNTLGDYWMAYYSLRRLTLYDFVEGKRLVTEN